jgi:hypothetical protein
MILLPYIHPVQKPEVSHVCTLKYFAALIPRRLCSFTPIHSLTSPVGQLFASRLGGAAVHVPVMHPHTLLELGFAC